MVQISSLLCYVFFTGSRMLYTVQSKSFRTAENYLRIETMFQSVKVRLTHTQTEPTYGHKLHDFITNVNQWILA